MKPRAHDPAILTDGLCKQFLRRRSLFSLARHPFGRSDRVTALDGVCLEVHRGEVFGLLGPNGAGKTTLLKVLCCLVVPDSGRGVVNGSEIASDELAVKQSVGYVTSDERSFYWRLTGTQNLTFFARLFRVPAAEIPSRVRHLLDRVELTDKADEPFSSYSSGMKQRLSIARALLHDPPVLFLDEPTRSLDPVTARHIRRFVSDQLAGHDGKTVLLATHNLHEAADLCHRMAILSAARVHRVGRLDEFRALFAAGHVYRLVVDRPVDLSGVARVLPDPGDGAAAPDTGGAPACRTAPSTDTGAVSLLIEPQDGGDGALSALVARLAETRVRVYELRRQETPLEEIFDRLFADSERSS
jgi:ABC-2 type transport system ATP-binding protein